MVIRASCDGRCDRKEAMPGQYYLFVPFSGDELKKVLPGEQTVKTIARIWHNDSKEIMLEERKRPHVIYYGETDANAWRLPTFNALEDTVYIIGHCHKGGSHLSSSRGGFRFDRAELDAQTLVDRLASYFPDTVVNFKLFACFGGSFVAQQNEQTGLMEYENSFAQKLYSRLKRKYRAAILTAYCLPVKGGLDSQGHKRLAMEDGRGHWGRPSANCVTYGA